MLGGTMRSGVVGLLPNIPAEITPAHAARLRKLGFTGASVMIVAPDAISESDLEHAREVLGADGIRVAQTNARYPALVHADEKERREGIRLASMACRAARILDSVYLLIRPGSLSPNGDWRPHRDNHASPTIDRLIDSLKQVCAAAEGEGVTIGLECHVISPLDSPRRVREVIEGVGSPALRYNADPVNFIASFADAYDTRTVLHRIFDELGQYTVSAHVKDVRLGDRLVVHIDECAPGEGIFDLAEFMRLYERHNPDGFALIEHLPDESIQAAKQALDAVMAEAGLAWQP